MGKRSKARIKKVLPVNNFQTRQSTLLLLLPSLLPEKGCGKTFFLSQLGIPQQYLVNATEIQHT